MLQVEVKSASDVPNPEKLGKCDPYTTVEFIGQKHKTEVIKGELHPEWNQKFNFDLAGQPISRKDELVFSIFDWERVGRNRLLGTARLFASQFTGGALCGDVHQNLKLNLVDGSHRSLPTVLCVTINYSQPQSIDAVDDGTVCEKGDSEDEDIDEGGTFGSPQLDPSSGKAFPVQQKKKRKWKRHGVRTLSAKSQDFQVRVKVMHARQLQGANVSPVVRVTVFNQIQQTRIQKSTNTPFWNQVFFFNFKVSPAELFDEILEFQVFNSRRLRSDALIGSFKCDLSLVYDETRHALLNKWLLLGDPEDIMAGAKGYLKISTVIVGPGDEPPSMKVSEKADKEDIESNLLRPAGVQLRPATFILRLYHAEDLPRMDSKFLQGVKQIFGMGDRGKQFVDPYFIFGFAGKAIHSRIIYSCDNPEWNQELRLGLQFPSMCERIKFTIKDWDRLTEDDTVGVYFLPLSMISASRDNGFLPCFGPCFVNIYGSTREYSDLPDEYADLNEGKGEGVAYRGRVLVELVSTLGETPETPIADIENDDLLRVQKYMRRRKYRIHAAFLSATMISAIDSPVEFEVSIGNYGNKLSENVPPSSSTTQPTNAVFDGCKYYFLPWSGTKPCVVVDCSFEDVSWRLEAVNVLKKIVNDLEANVERVSIAIQAKLPLPELAQLLIALLDQLIQDCSKQLPEPIKGVHVPNELDLLMAKNRATQLASIIDMASSLRLSATCVTNALSDVDGYLTMLRNMSIEPQISMPDVVIWMISGQKRLAFYRIPANEIFFSPDPLCRGHHCGKLQSLQLKFPGTKERSKDLEVPALLRVKLWLGLQAEEDEWHKLQTEGELAVFAETYENQVNILGSWTNKGPALSRPKFSDSEGNVELPKDDFKPPDGWKWDGDWYISPELSMQYDRDAGHHVFTEDLYECQSRNIPGGSWGEASRPWTDVRGDETVSLNSIHLQDGWEWIDDWQIDLTRAVDEEGFEYCVEFTMGGYGPVEKTYHLCRRRRWVRTRKHVAQMAKKDIKKQKKSEGWEYAPLFNMKFHATEHTTDLVRRRRWHRKMVAVDESTSCFFSMSTETDHKISSALAAPRMFLSFGDPFAQVCFMTQSMVTERMPKTLCPTWDQTLIFGDIEIHGKPRNLERHPPDVYIELFDHDTFGKPEFLGRAKAKPMIKLDPADARTPVMQWYEIRRSRKDGGELLAAFELFRLTEKSLPFLPPKRGNLFAVSNGIRPVMQRTGIEVLCWGVRNMKKFQLSNVTSPSIRFECGGHVMLSSVIKDTKRNPNFNDSVLFFDVMLPKEELYMPPMNINVIDHRNFGRRPLVGTYVLKSLENFRCNSAGTARSLGVEGLVGNCPPIEGRDVAIEIPSDARRKSKVRSHHDSPSSPGSAVNMLQSAMKWFNVPQFEILGYPIDVNKLLPGGDTPVVEEVKSDMTADEVDWWSKYYASTGETEKCKKYLESSGCYKIKLYDTELERSENYNGFSDFCSTFPLSRGKDDDDVDENGNIVGEFKGTFFVYPLPSDPNAPLPERMLSILPPSAPEECLIRVYVVKATNLQPNDPTGLADPYIQLRLGKKTLDNRDSYVPNSIDPVFGRTFELTATLPLHKDLKIRVMDYDRISKDDLIGETIIDLENRYLSKMRATCGLPPSYSISGINTWRDSRKPREILVEFCRKNTLAGPSFYGSTSVKVSQRVFHLTEFEEDGVSSEELGSSDERLALHVLNAFPLVNEHVECRPIYNTLQPGIEQGKLFMWVDMFPKSLGPPGPPFNITPRSAKQYELRCIIWNTVDVVLDEKSITGEKMSDIYVKGWLSGIDRKQQTDVHYRSLDGEGNFNWRFVFPFDYMIAEQTMIVKRKEHFWSLNETELHIPPVLMMQIWDNDKFTADDFLGTLELNLNSLPMPSKRSSNCRLSQLPNVEELNAVKTGSLFEMKRLRGFWPCYNEDTGERVLTGKLEMELELLQLHEAEEKPVGVGRDEPNALDKPKRPETSFLWFTSPFKTLKFIIWRNYRWVIIGVLLLFLLLLLVGLFIYSFPAEIAHLIMTSMVNSYTSNKRLGFFSGTSNINPTHHHKQSVPVIHPVVKDKLGIEPTQQSSYARLLPIAASTPAAVAKKHWPNFVSSSSFEHSSVRQKKRKKFSDGSRSTPVTLHVQRSGPRSKPKHLLDNFGSHLLPNRLQTTIRKGETIMKNPQVTSRIPYKVTQTLSLQTNYDALKEHSNFSFLDETLPDVHNHSTNNLPFPKHFLSKKLLPMSQRFENQHQVPYAFIKGKNITSFDMASNRLEKLPVSPTVLGLRPAQTVHKDIEEGVYDHQWNVLSSANSSYISQLKKQQQNRKLTREKISTFGNRTLFAPIMSSSVKSRKSPYNGSSREGKHHVELFPQSFSKHSIQHSPDMKRLTRILDKLNSMFDDNTWPSAEGYGVNDASLSKQFKKYDDHRSYMRGTTGKQVTTVFHLNSGNKLSSGKSPKHEYLRFPHTKHSNQFHLHRHRPPP